MNEFTNTPARGFVIAAFAAVLLWAAAGCAVMEWIEENAPEPSFPVLDEPGTLPGDEDEAPQSDAVAFSDLNWEYGGFSGSHAKRGNGVTIASLSVNDSGLSYEYCEGDLTAISPDNTHENADCIAALFVLGADGVWRGGKMDWISSDRKTRDFHNIYGGYKGWPSNAIESAEAFAFVIVSGDGKRRSNVISCEGGI